MENKLQFTIAPAKYAKGQMVVAVPSASSGWKTEGMYLAEALGGRWVHRSHGYHMSPKKAEQWQLLFEAGFRASCRVLASDPTTCTFRQLNGGRLALRDALKVAKEYRMKDKPYPYSSTPEERVREFILNDPRQRAEGILIGYTEVLNRRNGHIDILTTRHAVMEIFDLVIAASTSPELLGAIKDQRAQMNPIPVAA